METNTSQSPPTPPLFPLLFLKRGRWWQPCSSLFHSFMSAPLPPPEHTPRDTHTSTVSQMHTVFPRALEGRTFLLIQKREGQLAPGPSIIHMPESVDFGVQGCSSAQQSEDITVTRGHNPQWILKCFKATAARPVRNTRDLLNCVHYKCKVVNSVSQLRVLLPQVVRLQGSTNLKSVKL